MFVQTLAPDWVRFNLTHHFPVSKRLAAMKAFPLFALFAVLAGLFVYLWQLENQAAVYLAVSALVSAAICLCGLFYQKIWQNNFYYAIVGKCLIIRRGVFRRKKVHIPLSSINKVHLERSALDILFDLYRLNISVTATPFQKNLVLCGFSKSIAVDLREYLKAVLETRSDMVGAYQDDQTGDTMPLTNKVVSILESRQKLEAQNADDYRESLTN